MTAFWQKGQRRGIAGWWWRSIWAGLKTFRAKSCFTVQIGLVLSPHPLSMACWERKRSSTLHLCIRQLFGIARVVCRACSLQSVCRQPRRTEGKQRELSKRTASVFQVTWGAARAGPGKGVTGSGGHSPLRESYSRYGARLPPPRGTGSEPGPGPGPGPEPGPRPRPRAPRARSIPYKARRARPRPALAPMR